MEIKSGADYAELVIQGIQKIESEIQVEHKMPTELLDIWFEEIRSHADDTWLNYIIGNRDHYEFDEDEIKKIYELASTRYIQDAINSLVDKGMVDVSVGENGDILYGVTDLGKQTLDNSEKAE